MSYVENPKRNLKNGHLTARGRFNIGNTKIDVTQFFEIIKLNLKYKRKS